MERGRVTVDTIRAAVNVASVKGTADRHEQKVLPQYHPGDRQEPVMKVLRAMAEGDVAVFASGVVVTRTGGSWEVTVPD